MIFKADTETVNLLRARWKTACHVGEAMPYARAWVRTARLRRAFETVSASRVYSDVPGQGNSRRIWRGTWLPATEYRELPNLLSVELSTDFTQNGVTQAKIVIDNIGVVSTQGVAGVYHQIQRGYYSPLRGYRAPGRTAVGDTNDWFDIFRDKSTEITIVAGYGEDAAIPIFRGLLNEGADSTDPNQITITARDMGQLLTDQPTFANAKTQKVLDPITFADRRGADRKRLVRGGVWASGQTAGCPPSLAVDGRLDTAWRSEAKNDKDGMVWIEMTLPPGHYESFHLAPSGTGLECYVAVRARDKKAPGGKGARRYRHGERFADGEWISEDHGNVPGTSIPYVRRIKSVKGKGTTYRLPDKGYTLGENSKLRLYFTSLPRSYDHRQKKVRHRAAIRDFHAVRRNVRQEARDGRWILVDDAADVVRTVLQWCGLDVEWEIENTGVRLEDKLVFNRSDKLIDIIRKIAEMTNYVFFVKPPSQFDAGDLSKSNTKNLSLGVPVFRQNQAMLPARATLEPIESVSEDDLLTELSPLFTDEPLSYSIRVRGRRKPKRKGGRRLGGDKTPRIMYVYQPPWSRDLLPGSNWPKDDISNQFRNGNVKKYVVHHDPMLKTMQDCKIAALFIAFREALEAGKGTAEFPAMPTIYLDQQVSIRDTSVGISARLWTTNRTLSIQRGENPHFKMAIGGSILDTPDIARLRKEMVRALRRRGYNPGFSPAEVLAQERIERLRLTKVFK